MSKHPSKVDSPLRKIAWLAEFLEISVQAAYEKVRTKKIPEHCVVRLGGRIRVNEDLVRAWAANQSPAEAC